MEPTTNSATSKQKEEVKEFLSKGIGPLFKKVLCRPLDLNEEFKQGDTIIKSVVMILIAGVLFTLLPYLFIGESRRFLGFRFFLSMGVVIMLTLLFIGLISWGIKIIYKKKSNFQDELFTGALCALPLIILLILVCIISLFTSNNLFGGFGSIFNNGIGSLFGVYAFFLMITICFQSLRSVYIKANTAWYLSPITVMLAFYIAFKLIQIV